jgi:hypothetical protein
VTPALTKLVLGGGGGAGTRNNDNCGSNGATAAHEGQASSGAAGGGLILLRAGSLVAAPGAILSADGHAAYDDTLNDGGGGGGAGGSVIVAVTSGDLSNLTLRARGGKGGSAWKNSAPGTPGEFTVGAANMRHGPGGGGGGGVVVYTNTAVAPTLDVSGGASGITTTANSTFGALPGGVGQTLLAAPGLIPGAGSASDCSSDIGVTLAHHAGRHGDVRGDRLQCGAVRLDLRSRDRGNHLRRVADTDAGERDGLDVRHRGPGRDVHAKRCARRQAQLPAHQRHGQRPSRRAEPAVEHGHGHQQR